LDHLFVRGPVDVESGGVVDARASDHRPVVATVVVRGADGVR
jgi:endonuclease/exonuclease/phosphatase (EEP) superfamily protein YafD